MSAVLGRPMATVKRKIAELRRNSQPGTTLGASPSKPRLWTGAHEEELRRLHASGATDEQIGMALGRTREAVRKRRCLITLEVES